MLKQSFKTEIIISFLTERGNVRILDMEQNFDMSEMKPNYDCSIITTIYYLFNTDYLKCQ